MKAQYLAIFPGAKLVSDASRERHCKANSSNAKRGNQLLKDEGRFDEIRVRAGRTTSMVIMNDFVERQRRSDLMKRVNKENQEYFNKVRSEAAIRTSARPEIIEKRTENLARWREANPEKFWNIVRKFHESFKSGLEDILEERIKDLPLIGFRRNQQLRNTRWFLINRSHIRQLDFYNRAEKIIIECDGYIHFKNVERWNQLELVNEKDKELEKFCQANGFTLIRLAESCFDRRKRTILHEAIVVKLISEKRRGVFKFGEEYGEDSFVY